MPGHVVEGIDHGVELEVLAIGVNELLVLVAVREGSLLAEVDINECFSTEGYRTGYDFTIYPSGRIILSASYSQANRYVKVQARLRLACMCRFFRAQTDRLCLPSVPG